MYYGSVSEYALSVIFFDKVFPRNKKESDRRSAAFQYVADGPGTLEKNRRIEDLSEYIQKIKNPSIPNAMDFFEFFHKICEDSYSGFVLFPYIKGNIDDSSFIPSAYHDEELIISGLDTENLLKFYNRSVSDPVFSSPKNEFFHYTLIWSLTHPYYMQCQCTCSDPFIELSSRYGLMDDMDVFPGYTYDFDFEYAREEYRKGNKDIFRNFRPMTDDEIKNLLEMQ